MGDEPMKITLLGTASGIPTVARNCESVLLACAEAGYLFDAGEPCAASLVRAGIGPEQLRAVFLSHMHSDHSSGLPLLLQWMDLRRRRAPLSVCAPASALQGIRAYLALLLVKFGDRGYSFPLELAPVSEGVAYEDENVRVTAWANTHLAGVAEEVDRAGIAPDGLCLESYSFQVNVGGTHVVYSGDMGAPEDLDRFVDGTDLLLCELAHFAPERLFEYLAGKNVMRTVCLHIHPDWDARAEECLALGRRYLGDRVAIAHDGMELTL